MTRLEHYFSNGELGHRSCSSCDFKATDPCCPLDEEIQFIEHHKIISTESIAEMRRTHDQAIGVELVRHRRARQSTTGRGD